MVRVAQRPSIPTQQPATDYVDTPIPSGDGSILIRSMPRDMSVEPERKPQRKIGEIRPQQPSEALAEYQIRRRTEGAAAVRDTRALLSKPTVYQQGDTAVSGVRPSNVEPSAMEKKALEAQLKSNEGAVAARRGQLGPEERARYDALDAKVGDDPDTRLSLQRMLLEGRLDGPRLAALSASAEKDPAWRQKVREEATPERRVP